MNDSTVFVGVDYATAFVQVCILDAKGRQLGNRRCDNRWKDIADSVAPYGLPVRAAIEACTGAADLAAELLVHAGWSIDLAHPGYVRRMKQNPDKTDYTDARMLADLVRVGYLPLVWLPPLPLRELRRLIRYRQDQVKRRKTLKQRIGSLLRDHRCIPPPKVNPFTLAWWVWTRSANLATHSRYVLENMRQELDRIQQDIIRTEQYLEEATRDDPYVQRLQQIPGLALVTACWMRAEIGDPTRFRNGKQLARFCGLTPCNASSGLRQADAGMIRNTNRAFRGILIEAAHRLRRFSPRWKELGDRLTRQGKSGSVIAVAIGNRWMRSLYHELIEIQRDLQTGRS